jgi:hypothetical protein
MVEFALALPVFLLLMLGVIEFARLLVTYSAVYTASREAVRYGVATGMNPNLSPPRPHYQDCDGIRNAGMNLGRIGGVEANDFDIRYDRGLQEIPDEWTTLEQCSGATSNIALGLGDRIIVRVTTMFEPIVPLVNVPRMPVSSTTARTILSGVDVRGTPLPTQTRVMTYTPTITLTPTITTTPTETLEPSLTPTHTDTPTPGPSPTATDTLEPSETPTITETTTPTATGTVTITPTITLTPQEGLCGDFRLEFSTRSATSYTFRLFNDGTTQTLVRSLTLSWYDSDIKLWGFSGLNLPISTDSYSPWFEDDFSESQLIDRNSSHYLAFYFDKQYTLEPYLIVALENNCLLTAGLSPTPTPTTTGTPTTTNTPTSTPTPTATKKND